MMSLEDRLAFRPQRLQAALREVILFHRDILAGDFEVPKRDVPGLRDRFLAASGSPESLRTFVRELSAANLRALARGLVQWEGLEEKVELALRMRLQRHLAPVLWANLEGAPTNRPSLVLLRDILATGEHHLWPPEPWPSEAKVWISGELPGDGMVRWLREKGGSLAPLLERSDFPVNGDTPLSRHLFGSLLRAGSADMIRSEPPSDLTGGWGTLDPQGRIEAGRNLLSELPPDDWEDWILFAVEDSFGLPGAVESRAAFWEAIDESTRESFRLRWLTYELERFFSDHERAEYWKTRWVHEMKDFRNGKVGGTNYAVLDFGRFGVVEFMEIGHAAYFYSSEDLRMLLQKSLYSPADLKRPITYPVDRFTGDPQNRLIHSGAWPARADRRMARWLALNA